MCRQLRKILKIIGISLDNLLTKIQWKFNRRGEMLVLVILNSFKNNQFGSFKTKQVVFNFYSLETILQTKPKAT